MPKNQLLCSDADHRSGFRDYAINVQSGVSMFGKMLPIWAIILIEFCFVFGTECIMGSPCSFRLACKVFEPGKHIL